MTNLITDPANRPTTVRYRVLTWLSFAAVLAYYCRNSVGVAESTIRDQLKLSESDMGWFLGAFFWSYALFQVPAGYLGQKLGTRMVLTWGAISWSLGILLLSRAYTLSLLILAQLLIGLGQAAAFPCAVQSISAWFPKPSRARACSALNIGMQLGAFLTAMLTGVLIAIWDWRHVFLFYALPGFLWAIGFSAIFSNRPADDPRVNAAELDLLLPDPEETPREVTNPEDKGSTPWLAILTNRSVFCLCGQQVFRAAGNVFFATWFPTFLQATRGVNVSKSGLLQSSVFMASLLGGVLGGFVVDAIYQRTGNLKLSRAGVGAACMFCCSGLIFCSYFAKSTTLAMILIDLGVFVASMAGPCAYVTTIDLGKKHVPAVFGLMNMWGNLAAAAAPIGIGYLFEYTSDWNIILIVYGFVYLAAGLFWTLVNPTHSIDLAEQTEEEAK